VDFTDVTSLEMIEANVYAFDCDETLLRRKFDRITSPITEEKQRAAIIVICGARSEMMQLFKKN